MNVRMWLDEQTVNYWIPERMSETFALQSGGILLAQKNIDNAMLAKKGHDQNDNFN